MKSIASLACSWALLAATAGPAAEKTAGRPGLPVLRVEAEGFGASAADIKALLGSVAGQLWRYFPDTRLEPIVVVRSHQGPITLFQRNTHREIVVCLDTENTYWSQYSYQFAHEFCHVLCGFREDAPGNKWFEETLCETASLFVLRGMARSWKQTPPYPNWRDYRDSLREYADDVVRRRDQLDVIARQGLGAFYLTHQRALQTQPCDRELNGAMAVVVLRLLEKEPEHWEAVRWLNTAPSTQNEPFRQYLARWRAAVPPRHKAFVERISDLFGQK